MYSPYLKDSFFILLATVHFPQDGETSFHWCTSCQHTSDTAATLFSNFLIYSCSSFDIIASFPKHTKEFHKDPLYSHKLNIFMQNFALLFGMYCLDLSLPFQSNSSSSINRFLSGVYATLNFPAKFIYLFFYLIICLKLTNLQKYGIHIYIKVARLIARL